MLSSFICRQYFSKIVKTPLEAIASIKDGANILVGGFGFCGVPMNLVNALRVANLQNLHIISNSCGVDGSSLQTDWGLSMLLRTKQIKRMTFSHLGDNYQSQRQYFAGELALEVTPQGTLAEKIRCGGAGIPAFYTATGVGTVVETGGFPIKFKQGSNGTVVEEVSKPKPTKVYNGRKYLQEESIFADFALIKAKRADKLGNLQFHKTARNFNADMATAAKQVIVEVEQIVETGTFNPDMIHVPSVYVDKIYVGQPDSKFTQNMIQRLTLADHIEVKRKVRYSALMRGQIKFQENVASKPEGRQLVRDKIVKRAAKEVSNGMNVNLGIGIPTALPDVLPDDVVLNLQSQNGVLGFGHKPLLKEVDPDDINAGKETVTLNPGGAYFSSSLSFGMIRGGHLDLAMLGSLQVSENCDIANWMIPNKLMKGMGGAMDLVSSGSRVIVLMQHSALLKNGKREIKLLPECTLPLTAKGVVDMVITELAVFKNQNGRLVLIQIANETTLEEVQAQTGFKINAASTLGRF